MYFCIVLPAVNFCMIKNSTIYYLHSIFKWERKHTETSHLQLEEFGFKWAPYSHTFLWGNVKYGVLEPLCFFCRILNSLVLTSLTSLCCEKVFKKCFKPMCNDALQNIIFKVYYYLDSKKTQSCHLLFCGEMKISLGLLE